MDILEFASEQKDRVVQKAKAWLKSLWRNLCSKILKYKKRNNYVESSDRRGVGVIGKPHERGK